MFLTYTCWMNNIIIRNWQINTLHIHWNNPRTILSKCSVLVLLTVRWCCLQTIWLPYTCSECVCYVALTYCDYLLVNNIICDQDIPMAIMIEITVHCVHFVSYVNYRDFALSSRPKMQKCKYGFFGIFRSEMFIVLWNKWRTGGYSLQTIIESMLIKLWSQ